jgi:hypothetical protein
LCLQENPIKTARITFLGSPQFKANLERQARLARVSLGELIRSQFEAKPAPDEALLIALTKELRATVEAARQAVAQAVAETDAALAEFRARPGAAPGKPSKKADRRQAA